MLPTPFHAYYTARLLENLPDGDKLLPVFASSDIKAYPFQIAAAGFVLRSNQKGVILCDEAGMGKSHEAMLIMAQRWLEGYSRILLCIPNADLLEQWTDILDRYYTIPYTALTNRKQWEESTDADHPNGFDQVGIVITTYDFAADHEDEAAAIDRSLIVFEEANALSGAYQDNNKQARSLHRIAGNAFKVLLTGTPIEKNIMDLYGMIWFIDDTVFPDAREFLSRYLRKPENYPELAERVSPFCFRTLRSQAKDYAKVPERVLMTVEYTPSPEEQTVYDLLYAYINRPKKLAFPEMDPYDLALRLLGIQSSSTAAIAQTLQGIIRRLENTDDAQEEITELQTILDTCRSITIDAKAKELMSVLDRGFRLMKKLGAKKKAVVFTESIETQKMLFPLVSQKYKTVLYNGGTDYSAIRQFKQSGEVLISTDNGAKGFNLEDAAFIIHYDLLYNTLKMEQRIDRCHRLGQQNDVLSVAFINKENFSDVRKLELVSKRMLVSNGVFGVSDDVIGGFTDDAASAFDIIANRLRTTTQIEADHQNTISSHAEENKQLVASAEDMLFTTFTKELANKVKLTPQYIDERTEELNRLLWELTKWFFTRYNAEHTDCRYEIDDAAQTITATQYDTLPVLFYYWDGSRNRKYRSQKAYGMGKDFKPRHGRITLTSIIGRGIIHELECADTGTLIVRGCAEPCTLGLYQVALLSGKRRVAERSVLAGKTESGAALSEEQCRSLMALPVIGYTESEHKAPHWLKSSRKPHELDKLVPVQALIDEQAVKLSPAQEEEAAELKQQTAAQKAEFDREIDALDTQIRALEAERGQVTGNRLKILALDKQINQLRREHMTKQESQFFEAMRLDVELEEKLKALSERDKIIARVEREFVLKTVGG